MQRKEEELHPFGQELTEILEDRGVDPSGESVARALGEAGFDYEPEDVSAVLVDPRRFDQYFVTDFARAATTAFGLDEREKVRRAFSYYYEKRRPRESAVE